ncbi:putative transcriptional regulator YdeE [Paenibacillus mucilaginosus]|uniref:GyrI-like domain-containing protein n=1 Tax=Paenibacillus mucilaginosus TaxID=61624 RepID=UPI003D1F7CE7
MPSPVHPVSPELVTLPSFTIAGISFEANLKQISEEGLGRKAYETMLSRREELADLHSPYPHLVQVYPMKPGFNPHVDAFRQIIGFLVPEGTEPPEGISVHTLPAREYVKAAHRGPEAELGSTYDALYGDWMRKNNRCPDGFDFEVWDERYRPDREDNEIDVYIALAKP